MFPNAQSGLGIAFGTDHHIVMEVNASFGKAGAAGGVEPESRVVLAGGCGLQFR